VNAALRRWKGQGMVEYYAKPQRLCTAQPSHAAVWAGRRASPFATIRIDPECPMSLQPLPPVADLDLALERDVFLRTLVGELALTLQDVVGLDEASGFVSVVGQRVGEQINEQYKQALALPQLSREQVRDVLIDLKRRIQGRFYVLEEDDEKIVLGNHACPFGDKVVGRPALCMMTSNVFGIIAAENLGYAKVTLHETIASGAPGCRVTVHLKPTAAAESASGRDYFRR
jgi:hypothetical protein